MNSVAGCYVVSWGLIANVRFCSTFGTQDFVSPRASAAAENLSFQPDNSFDMESMGEEIEEVNLAHAIPGVGQHA